MFSIPKEPTSPPALPTAISASLNMLKAGDYTDAIIRCKDREWKVHKNIICTRCTFFRACFDQQFEEANKGVVILQEDEPDYVQYLLTYIYTYDLDLSYYTLPESKRAPENSVLPFELLQLADKYDQRHLYDHWLSALHKLVEQLESALGPYKSLSREIGTMLTKTREFLVNAYSFETPGLEAIRNDITRALVRNTGLVSTFIADECGQKFLETHPEATIAMIGNSPQQTKALQTLIAQPSIREVLLQDSAIAMKLLRDLCPTPQASTSAFSFGSEGTGSSPGGSLFGQTTQVFGARTLGG